MKGRCSMATNDDSSTILERIFEELEKIGKAKYKLTLSRCPNSNTIMNVCTEKIYDALRNGKINPPTRSDKGKVFPAAYIEIWARQSNGIKVKPTLDGRREGIREKVHLALTDKHYIEKSDPFVNIPSDCKSSYVSKEKYVDNSVNDIMRLLSNSGFYDDVLNTLSEFEEKLLQNL